MLSSMTLAAVAGLLFSTSITAAPLMERATLEPVITTDFPDPTVILIGQTWYAFGTQSIYNYTDIHIQIATSPDFKTWTVTGKDALPSLPSWVDASNPAVWAPSVVERDDGTFLMYFSATTNTAGNGRFHCFGTATSSSIEGPYIPTDDVFTCPTDQGGALDASGFQDSDGTRYVVYKIDANSLGNGGSCLNTVPPIKSTPIMIQQVEADGITKVGDAIELIANDAADGPLVEAPSMVKNGDGTYILFFSSNCYLTTDYDVTWATSSSPTSGFVKRGPLFVTGNYGLYGPGGATIDTDGVNMVFHGYATSADVGKVRSMYATTVSMQNTEVTMG